MYSNQTISKRLKELDITQKIASVEAYQAQREHVQQRVYAFWNHAPPLGICGIPRRMLIDVDEFGCQRMMTQAMARVKETCRSNNGHGSVNKEHSRHDHATIECHDCGMKVVL